ncbi:MAG: hypothetical protein V3W45_03975 [Sedimentisphaerales bacterium]
MSPNRHSRERKVVVYNNLYTIVLAIALCVVLATATLVAYKCYFQYGTIFKIP